MSAEGSGKSDLERTDKLPILDEDLLDELAAKEVADDAVPLDAAEMQPVLISQSQVPDFARLSNVDLPALAESVRSVEERIARQSADYEALSRLYDRSKDAESAAEARAAALAADLARTQSTLAVAQHRTLEMERTLADKVAAEESARTRLEEALRAAERHQSECATLREALAAREAGMAQALHSLGERDAQLHALQGEHATTVETLAARTWSLTERDVELQTARARIESLERELAEARRANTALEEQSKRKEGELIAVRRDLLATRLQGEGYLEILRSREWRRGFDQNLIREWSESASAGADAQALAAERDRLRQSAAALNAKVLEQEELIARKNLEIEDGQRACAQLTEARGAFETECARLVNELQARNRAVLEAREQGSDEVQRVREVLANVERERTEQKARIDALEAAAATHEEEMAVLLAHLAEARRPAQTVQAETQRLHGELAAQRLALEQLNDDNQQLRATLERTRGALEEREFLIRRLERSESNNANALGRLQTSIEKLGATPPPPPPPVEECSGELIRLDEETPAVPFVLARRTRIGRAPGCELQLDSSSVSRYHALLLKGPRDVIIEDLNSTNGVLVNGRKISRHLLKDGDLVTVGDIKFKFAFKVPAGSPAGVPAAGRDATAEPVGGPPAA